MQNFNVLFSLKQQLEKTISLGRKYALEGSPVFLAETTHITYAQHFLVSASLM